MNSVYFELLFIYFNIKHFLLYLLIYKVFTCLSSNCDVLSSEIQTLFAIAIVALSAASKPISNKPKSVRHKRDASGNCKVNGVPVCTFNVIVLGSIEEFPTIRFKSF